MDNKVYVDSEQLTSVAASIKVKANNILNIFQGDCSSAIILGKECLQVSGLDTTAIINSLNKIFTNLSTRINTLSDFLTQKVAGEYDLTSQSIINAFNGNFATELAALLGLTVGTTVVPGVTGNGAGTAGSTGGIATGIIRPSTGGSSGGCSSCVSSDTQDQAEHLRTDGTSVWLTNDQLTKLMKNKDYEIISKSSCPVSAGGCYYEIRDKNGEILSESEVKKVLGIGVSTPIVSTGSSGNNNTVVSETPKETVTPTNETSIKTQEAENNATVTPAETEKLNKAVVSGNKNEILAAQKDLDKATGKPQQTSFQTIWQSMKDDVNKTKKPVSEASDLDRAVISGDKNAIAAASKSRSSSTSSSTSSSSSGYGSTNEQSKNNWEQRQQYMNQSTTPKSSSSSGSGYSSTNEQSKNNWEQRQQFMNTNNTPKTSTYEYSSRYNGGR